MSQPQFPRLRRKLTQEEMTVYQRGTQCDRGGVRCGGRSSSEWVRGKARELPWPTRQSEEAGVWSRGLHTTPQFPSGSTELLLGLLLPQSSLAGFPHTTWSIEQGFSISALLIFWAG